MRPKTVILWFLQIIVAGILFWTAWNKLSSKPESILMFSELGMEPVGRYIIGAIELCAAAFLINGRVAAIGAVLALGTMLGAIIAHATVLGSEIAEDGGRHMFLLSIVFFASLTIAVLRRRQLPFIGGTFEEGRLPYS